MGQWAAHLFRAALPTVAGFNAPRSWIFTLLGLDDYCAVEPADREAAIMRSTLANDLTQMLLACESADWVWFEDALTYDNARYCEALVRTGRATGAEHMVEVGLRALRWLMTIQTAPSGHFRPVGSTGFALIRSEPLAFDQQPVEAAATIAACLAAHDAEPGGSWAHEAGKAFDWFMGENDLGVPLVNISMGSCRDGLHPDRANENRGAESVLAYLMGLADMRKLEAVSHLHTAAPMPAQPVRATSPLLV